MSSEIRQAFGRRVRELRVERGFSLRKFALTIGADKSFLVDIEYGRKSPHPRHHLAHLARTRRDDVLSAL